MKLKVSAPISYNRDYVKSKVKEIKLKDTVGTDQKEVRARMANGESIKLLFKCIQEYLDIISPHLGWSNDMKRYNNFIKVLYGTACLDWIATTNNYNG